MKRNWTATEIERDAVNALIDFLNDNEDFQSWDDLHYEVYNSDYFYIYYTDARRVLNEYDVFKAIEEVKEYEQDNFGEVHTDFSNPCEVANMLLYILGEELLFELDLFNMDEDTETAEVIDRVEAIAA